MAISNSNNSLDTLFLLMAFFLKNSAGCGGVLKNQNGEIKAIFSGLVNCVGLDFSRLSAIKSAMEIFIESDWMDKVELIIEVWWKVFDDIDRLSRRIGHVKFVFNQSSYHGMEACLAKDGINRKSFFKAWW
ncbi:hypothetical protein GQ457_10G006200 [Hibiscus cannabinus]